MLANHMDAAIYEFLLWFDGYGGQRLHACTHMLRCNLLAIAVLCESVCFASLFQFGNQLNWPPKTTQEDGSNTLLK